MYFFMEALKSIGSTDALSVFFWDDKACHYLMGCILQELGNLRELVFVEINQ